MKWCKNILILAFSLRGILLRERGVFVYLCFFVLCFVCVFFFLNFGGLFF